MDGTTTRALHQAADRAAEEGDFWTALRCVADILAQSPADHWARTKLALSLAALGHESEAVRTLAAGARELTHRGFILSALGMARDALGFAPNDPEVWAAVEAARAVATPGDRARVPPPVPPEMTLELRPFLEIQERSELLARAAELGATVSPLEPVESSPLPLFGAMGGEVFRSTVAEIELRKLRAGVDVVQQGEPGDALFVVIRGEVEVLRSDARVAVLGAGAFFGELSLFLQKARSATVRTLQPTELFVLSREQVERLADRHPELSDVLAEFARRRLLANVLASSPIFAPFPGAEKRQILAAFETRLVPEGQVIIRQGDLSAGLFVVVEGQVQVTTVDEHRDPVVLAHLGPGEVFGEIALIQDGQATATVTTTESCMLLQLPRDGFSELLRGRPQARAYLDGLSETRLAELRSALATQDQVLDADDLIIV